MAINTAGFDGPPTKGPMSHFADMTDLNVLSPTSVSEEELQHMDGEGHGAMTRDEGLGYDFEVKEQDRWLPIANVARIMKTALPQDAKISKEARECMQECISEFISFVMSEASEKCQREKRKTVNGEDILSALSSLGFENYAEVLKIYLTRYRENLVARGEHQKPNVASNNNDGAKAR